MPDAHRVAAAPGWVVGSVLRGGYPHVAVQIEPEEGRILEPERARRYLENYFSKGADISLFWGSAEDFLKELNTRWKESARYGTHHDRHQPSTQSIRWPARLPDRREIARP